MALQQDRPRQAASDSDLAKTPAPIEPHIDSLTSSWPSEPWGPPASLPVQPVAGQPSAIKSPATSDDPTRGAGRDATDETEEAADAEEEEHVTDAAKPAPMYRLPTVEPASTPERAAVSISTITAEAAASDRPVAELESPALLAKAIMAMEAARSNSPPTFALGPREAPTPCNAPAIEMTPLQPYIPHFAEAYLYTPTSTEITAQVLPAVQRACGLAQQGAVYAAHAEFIQVLRRIAQANDAECGTDQHSRALAEGLRALDEAADFVPTGTGLEGELDVRIAASSHRTPVFQQCPIQVAPHTAVALYHSYAEERLAAAVGGQQAGSMALYGLGKVEARLAVRNGDDMLESRNAMTMYAAALAACPSNHLAANELGVLLCRSGHTADAARLFEQAIDGSPSATSYHNLATAQRQLGLGGQARANQKESDRLATIDRSNGAISRKAGIEWVSPDAMSQVAVAPTPAVPVAEQGAPAIVPAAPLASSTAPTSPTTGPAKTVWEKATEIAKSLPLPGIASNDNGRAEPAGPHSVTPGTHAVPTIPWH